MDDQAVFRRIADEVIAATDGFEAVGEADSGYEALEAVQRLSPDLVLLDVRMPGLDGIEVARRIAASRSDVVVVLISIDELADLTPTGDLEGAVPVIRKQDFGPRLLRRLWTEHGICD